MLSLFLWLYFAFNELILYKMFSMSRYDLNKYSDERVLCSAPQNSSEKELEKDT